MTFQTDNIRIQVTNNHIQQKGVWVFHVRELNWHCKPLDIPPESTEDVAIDAAKKMVKHHLFVMIAELEG